jgi:predicted RNase H-like HicB family nuclease
MAELIFEVRDAEEGGFHARALGKPIFTQADTWDELRSNILEAVEVFFDTSEELPKLVQLHYVKDELLAVNAA